MKRRITLTYKLDTRFYPGELADALTKSLEVAGISVVSASAEFTPVVSEEWKLMMAEPEPSDDGWD